MTRRIYRRWLVLGLLPLLMGLAAATSARTDARGDRVVEGESCPAGAAVRAAEGSLIPDAERYWGGIFGEVDFEVWRAVCGHLAGRHGADMVIALGLVDGTGGSPKPWGIFNRTEQGGFRLGYESFGRKLICPMGMRIHDRALDIYRPLEYLGGYTVCDQIMTFRWTGRSYKRVDPPRVQTVRPEQGRCQVGLHRGHPQTAGIRFLVSAWQEIDRGKFSASATRAPVAVLH